MKHTFTYEQEFEQLTFSSIPETRVEYTIESAYLPEMLEAFENYLKACGFVFDGHVEIVEDEDE